MLGDKVDALINTGADVCTGGDASCLMHIGGGLSRTRELKPQDTHIPPTVHLARILASTKERPLTLTGGSVR